MQVVFLLIISVRNRIDRMIIFCHCKEDVFLFQMVHQTQKVKNATSLLDLHNSYVIGWVSVAAVEAEAPQCF